MKIQDIVFIVVLFVLLVAQKQKWFIHLGLLCLILAMPLFAKWIFFTAERLTWYGIACISIGIMYTYLIKKGKT
jgi:hypothetical protein